MQTGNLDQVIYFESLTETNTSGALQQTWNDEGRDWCKVLPVRGDESFQSARVNARAFIRIKLRYRDDVTEKWRLLWDGDAYNIIYIDRSARRSGELWITAELNGAGDRPFLNTSVTNDTDNVIDGTSNVVVEYGAGS